MATINIYCENCGNLFSTGSEVYGGGTTTFSRSTIQCPYCGQAQTIPDGDYRERDGMVEVFLRSSNPVQEAKDLLTLLRGIKSEEQFQVFRNKPEQEKFSKWIPKSFAEIGIVIQILLQVIAILLQNSNANQTNVTNTINNTTINNHNYYEAPRHIPPVVKQGVKTGRNVLCPCGSGKKFKYCHGRDTNYYPVPDTTIDKTR